MTFTAYDRISSPKEHPDDGEQLTLTVRLPSRACWSTALEWGTVRLERAGVSYRASRSSRVAQMPDQIEAVTGTPPRPIVE